MRHVDGQKDLYDFIINKSSMALAEYAESEYATVLVGERLQCGRKYKGGAVSPPQWGPRAMSRKMFGYLAFCGAQNIVFVVVCDDKQ